MSGLAEEVYEVLPLLHLVPPPPGEKLSDLRGQVLSPATSTSVVEHVFVPLLTFVSHYFYFSFVTSSPCSTRVIRIKEAFYR